MTLMMGFLIVAFALWGVQGYFSQSANNELASVNGEEISLNEYNNRLSQQRQTMLNRFGNSIDPSYFESAMFKRNLLESMINSRLLRQMAIDNDFVVTDTEIKSVIEAAPSFKNEQGQFDKQLYAAFLTQTNQSAAYLQQQIRQGLFDTAVNDTIETTAFVTAKEQQKMASLNNQTRDFDYVLLKPSDFIAQVQIDQQQIEQHYNENQNNYMTPEQVSVDYIRINADDIAKEIEVDDQQALQYFEDNKDTYQGSEQRQASHILINDGDDALVKITQLKNQLDNGAVFAELAKQNSQDPGSKDSGGDLGWVKSGEMVPEFDAELFKMEKGKISEPIKTEFGYHLIYLKDIKPAQEPVFEAVKADIIQALQAQQAETLFLDKVSELSSQVLDAEDNLDAVADQSGVAIQTTELFDRNSGQGIAENPAVREAAFSAIVKDELQNSDAINLSDTDIVFIHLNQVKEAELKPLEEVKQSIEDTLKNNQAAELAQQQADAIAAQINSQDKTLAQLAEAEKLTVVNAKQVKRSGSSYPYNLVKNVFSMDKPAQDKTITAVQQADGNELAVVTLTAVQDGKVDAQADLTAESAQLLRSLKANEQQLLIKALREASSIQINQELLEKGQL